MLVTPCLHSPTYLPVVFSFSLSIRRVGLVWGADSQDAGMWRLTYMNEVTPCPCSWLAWPFSPYQMGSFLLRLILKISRMLKRRIL